MESLLLFVPPKYLPYVLGGILLLSIVGSVAPKTLRVPYLGRVIELCMGVGIDRERILSSLRRKKG